MRKSLTYRRPLAGFSLIELAVVIFITGIMLSSGLTLLTLKMNAAQLELTTKNQEIIKQALINYLGKNRRLPCPTTVANGNIAAPFPPCASNAGIVPYYELGLDRAVALDGWGNFITYVVTPNPISSVPPAPYRTAWLYGYSPSLNSSPNTTNGALAFWPSTSTGGITVTDGTNLIANPANASGAVVALISYGKNGYGAFNIKGATNTPPPLTNADELKNINPVSVPAQPTVVIRDTTDSATVTGGPFDDIVMMLSANDLTGPLIANGTQQASAQAALNQANDIVIGNIVSSRSSPCPCSYTIPSTFTFATPPAVATWGITYAPTVSSISQATPPGPGIAYTLTAGDQTQRTISIDELRGILGRIAGFN